jgi:hypothetical protein
MKPFNEVLEFVFDLRAKPKGIELAEIAHAGSRNKTMNATTLGMPRIPTATELHAQSIKERSNTNTYLFCFWVIRLPKTEDRYDNFLHFGFWICNKDTLQQFRREEEKKSAEKEYLSMNRFERRSKTTQA